MPQAIALSTELVGLTEDLVDTWETVTADGHVCPLEIARVTVLVVDINTRAGLVDLAQAAGLAVIRRGADAQRSAGLLRQVNAHTP